MLRISFATVVLACVLQIRPDHRVELGLGPSMAVPELCGSRILFNADCPGCGLTRSFISLVRGDIWRAWSLNRTSWVFFIALLAQFPYRLWRLRELQRNVVSEHKWPKWFGLTLIWLLVLNWILKVAGI